jgi:hypothetical protein
MLRMSFVAGILSRFYKKWQDGKIEKLNDFEKEKFEVDDPVAMFNTNVVIHQLS